MNELKYSKRKKRRPGQIRMTELDKLWAQAVKKRDGYRCRRCKKQYAEGGRGIQAAHIVPRRHKTTRWLMDNGITLCFGCHHWAHSDPLEFTEWLRKEIGDIQMGWLEIKRHETWRKDTLPFECELREFMMAGLLKNIKQHGFNK